MPEQAKLQLKNSWHNKLRNRSTSPKLRKTFSIPEVPDPVTYVKYFNNKVRMKLILICHMLSRNTLYNSLNVGVLAYYLRFKLFIVVVHRYEALKL